MTNKPMLSVERELVLENIAYLRGIGGSYYEKSSLSAKFESLLLEPATEKHLRVQYESWADAKGYDVTRNEHGDYVGIVEDSMWTGWQARDELRALLDKEVDGDSHAPKHQGEPVAWVMPEHTMRSVMDAIQQARGFPVLTSNQCHALANSLNYVARLNGVKP